VAADDITAKTQKSSDNNHIKFVDWAIREWRADPAIFRSA